MTQPVNTAEFLGMGKKKEKWNYSLFQSVVLSSEIKIYSFRGKPVERFSCIRFRMEEER